MADRDSGRRDFFVSYTGADRSWAEWLVAELEAAGYTTVSQARDFVAGSNFPLEMDRATSLADRTMLVLTQRALEAPYVQQEWAARLASDPTGAKRALVPVRVEPCELGGLLGPITYIDLVGLDEQGARQRLRDEVDALMKGARRPRAGASPWAVADRPRFPTELPPVWSMPFLRNRVFTDREQVLVELAGPSEDAGTAIQAIVGLGGVGKTQLAVEHAYRRQSHCEVVWWLRAESPTTLVGDYAALAGAVNLPEAAAGDQGVVVAAARHWLEGSSGWLLVLDNAPGPEDPLGVAPFQLVADLLPRGGQGQVLVTSRNSAWENFTEVEAVPLDVMEMEDAVDLLRLRTGSTDLASTTALAEALGCLPLALEQAGAYIRAAGISPAAYLQRFQRSVDFIARQVPKGRAVSVATTWQVSIERIRHESPGAAEVLECAAFLAPEDLPRDLFANRVEGLTGALAALAEDPVALDEAVMTLRRYSLVKAAENALTVHRLVQAVVRQLLDEATRKQQVVTCLRLVRAVFPDDSGDVAARDECQRLLPHALAAAGHAEQLAVGLRDAAWLFDRSATYLQARARYPEAKAAVERAVRLAETVYGPEHPEVARILGSLGVVRRYLGDFAGARAALERTLAIQESAYGPDHAEVGATLANLGGVLRDSGQLAEARATLQRALAIQQAAYGPDHVEVALTLGNLARVLRYLGEVTEARAALEKVLAVMRAVYGPDHPRVGVTLSNLGCVLLNLGEKAEAVTVLEEALAIEEAAFGEQHPWVAITLSNLGSARRAVGSFEQARQAYERAVTILQTVFGPEHPEAALTLNNLGLVQRDLGDLAAARASLERALEIEQAAYRSDQPGIGITMANLGVVLFQLDERAAAREALERALAILALRLAPTHPRIQVLQRHLARIR